MSKITQIDFKDILNLIKGKKLTKRDLLGYNGHFYSIYRIKELIVVDRSIEFQVNHYSHNGDLVFYFTGNYQEITVTFKSLLLDINKEAKFRAGVDLVWSQKIKDYEPKEKWKTVNNVYALRG